MYNSISGENPDPIVGSINRRDPSLARPNNLENHGAKSLKSQPMFSSTGRGLKLRQRQQTEWTADLAEASKICDELNRAKEGLEQERMNLVARNQTVETEIKRLELQVTEARQQIDAKDRQLETNQLDHQQLRQRVEQLEEENAEFRGRTEHEEPLKCPVCLEVYTSERRVVALFCSHMLCNLCHQRLTELDSSSLCPMCRGVEVTNCLSLF
ncbi:hypothetical protein BpHYR1_048527 [Brachionus plicatilis]|uniref:RING-type domain-containing protein n=1 Tax=Brachionus plicatilis TaxID=10195 RepID=A0A3M7Q6T1_BRAPC|nr:hypothetical protein BpHYR1_048527 [Brachionus plicatilis]